MKSDDEAPLCSAEGMDAIFKPRAIAVIGASRKEKTIGRAIIDNLLKYDYNGMIFPVNPKAQVVRSIKSYGSVSEVQDEVDLAVVIVPKQHVISVAKECGQKGVKGLVVISAGFREVGGDGIKLEEELKQVVGQYNMRMIGPNCMGVINFHPQVMMDATFSPSAPPPGRIAFLSQSGALGVIILARAEQLGLGFSIFASMGNKADVSANDLLEYLKDDDQTDVILMYLENFGNPKNFPKIAKKITKVKPIIAVKAGRTLAGARAASSHTGALAEVDVAAEALFEQCGILRVRTIDELFDLALAFSNQPLPKGNRIAIVSNAGGPAIMATDAAVSLNLEIPRFSDELIEKLRQVVPQDASVSNPVDLIAMGGAKEYEASLDLICQSGEVDSVLVIFVTPIIVDTKEIVEVIEKVNRRYDIPILGCVMGKDEDKGPDLYDSVHKRVPMYAFPESAVNAIRAMTRYSELRARPEGKIHTFEVDKKGARKIISQARRENRERLLDTEVQQILEAYRFPVPRYMITTSIKEATEFADQIGYPVVVKVIAEDVVHKSDVGGVYIDIKNKMELKGAIYEMRDNFRNINGYLVQEMVDRGKEVILGMNHDPVFGPLIMFGMGGIYVETIKDISVKIWPISDVDAREMIESIKGYPLLKGVRGEKPIDFELIMECIMRLSQLVGDHPEIKELDFNPIICFPKGKRAKIVDARISIFKD